MFEMDSDSIRLLFAHAQSFSLTFFPPKIRIWVSIVRRFTVPIVLFSFFSPILL